MSSDLILSVRLNLQLNSFVRSERVRKFFYGFGPKDVQLYLRLLRMSDIKSNHPSGSHSIFFSIIVLVIPEFFSTLMRGVL